MREIPSNFELGNKQKGTTKCFKTKETQWLLALKKWTLVLIIKTLRLYAFHLLLFSFPSLIPLKGVMKTIRNSEFEDVGTRLCSSPCISLLPSRGLTLLIRLMYVGTAGHQVVIANWDNLQKLCSNAKVLLSRYHLPKIKPKQAEKYLLH